MTSAGSRDVFVAKLDANGNTLWAISGGGTASDSAHDLAVSAGGTSVITGAFLDSATFGTHTITATNVTSDIFVARISSSGAFTYAASAGGISPDSGNAVGLDSAGNAYVVGTFASTNAKFGSHTVTSSSSTYNEEIFVAKVDPTGLWVWAVGAGGTGNDYGQDIAVRSNGTSYIVGSFTTTATFGTTTLAPTQSGGHAYIAQLSSSGVFGWAQDIEASSNAFGVAADSSGPVLTGWFQGTVSIGGTTLTAAGLVDAYVARMNTSGAFTWAAQVTAAGTVNNVRAAAIDGSGNVFVGGTYPLNTCFGSVCLPGNNSNSAFVARLSPAGSFY